MYSIKRRLLLVLAAGFAILIAGAAVFMESTLRDQASAEFDAALIAEARALVSLTEQEGGQVEFDYDAAYMTQFEREDNPDLFQFWLEDGSMLLRSTRLTKDLPRAEGMAPGPRLRDAPLADGRAGRLVQLTFVPKSPGPDDPEEMLRPSGATRMLVLVVARGRGPLDRVLAGMRWAIFGAGGIAAVLGLLLVSWALAAGFRPIVSIAEQVGALDAEHLGSRVTLPRPPRELAPITEQLNALLGRLHDSFDRERRFTGNVAHELKTPLAELRSLAEVGARWPEDRSAIVGFFDDVGDIAVRMESVIADLLLLARCQAGAEQAMRAPTDLEEVISAAWSRVEPQARSARIRFSLHLPPDSVVDSDAGKLDLVFANLLGNAVSYARPGSEIRCSGVRNGKVVSVEITNDAEPLDAADLERLSEPFWRKDEARSSAQHAGLGLSLVVAVSVLLGMQIGFTQDQDGTFRVRMEHPV